MNGRYMNSKGNFNIQPSEAMKLRVPTVDMEKPAYSFKRVEKTR
jgi:hypothetical protein